MHQIEIAPAPGSVSIWNLYNVDEEVPVGNAHTLAYLAASPETIAIHAHTYGTLGYSEVTVKSIGNQKATYILKKEEAEELAPEERLALVDCVKRIGVNTSCDLFRKTLGI